ALDDVAAGVKARRQSRWARPFVMKVRITWGCVLYVFLLLGYVGDQDCQAICSVAGYAAYEETSGAPCSWSLVRRAGIGAARRAEPDWPAHGARASLREGCRSPEAVLGRRDGRYDRQEWSA